MLEAVLFPIEQFRGGSGEPGKNKAFKQLPNKFCHNSNIFVIESFIQSRMTFKILTCGDNMEDAWLAGFLVTNLGWISSLVYFFSLDFFSFASQKNLGGEIHWT